MRSQGPYEIDDSPDRVDLDAAWQFLSAEAYWGRWRSPDDVQRQIHGAWRVVGCYDGQGHMVGFARALSDGVALAYLAEAPDRAGQIRQAGSEKGGSAGGPPRNAVRRKGYSEDDSCLSILYSIRCYVKVLRDSPGGHERE